MFDIKVEEGVVSQIASPITTIISKAKMSTGQLRSSRQRKAKTGSSSSSFQQGLDSTSTNGFRRAFQGVMNTLSPAKRRGATRSNGVGPRVAISGFGDDGAEYKSVSENDILYIVFTSIVTEIICPLYVDCSKSRRGCC